MEAKHTPGPWKVGMVNESRTSGVYGEIAIQAASGYFTACAVPCGNDGDRKHRVTQANAHLIASAPELYAVVRRLVEICDQEDWPIENDMGLLEDARKAFAKAEGRQP